ncbi:hypothetical protein [Fischerella sp. PCC 9605]|uniref:hypothetical protein n=1 Tax=Fischerella sp. PCC 9605 TaxID=1173024 RepID=UPI0004AD3E3D
MVSLQSEVFKKLSKLEQNSLPAHQNAQFYRHRWWQNEAGWKNILNNLRLIVQPKIFLCLLTPWLLVFPIPNLMQGLLELVDIMNEFKPYLPSG